MRDEYIRISEPALGLAAETLKLGLQQTPEFVRCQRGLACNRAHRVGVNRIGTRDGEPGIAVGHDDVFSPVGGEGDFGGPHRQLEMSQAAVHYL